MLGFFRRIFKKQNNTPKKLSPKEMKRHLCEYKSGDVVRLVFKNPVDMGFSRADATTYTRFNPSELVNRTISGMVSKCWYEDYPLDERLIEVTVVKEHGNIRKFLFLSQEIETIERLK